MKFLDRRTKDWPPTVDHQKCSLELSAQMWPFLISFLKTVQILTNPKSVLWWGDSDLISWRAFPSHRGDDKDSVKIRWWNSKVFQNIDPSNWDLYLFKGRPLFLSNRKRWLESDFENWIFFLEGHFCLGFPIRLYHWMTSLRFSEWLTGNFLISWYY